MNTSSREPSPDEKAASIANRYYFLTLSIIVWAASVAAFLVSGFLSWNLLVGIAMTVAISSGLVYLCFLGALAASLGRSPLLWVAGAIIGGPLGIIITHSRMKSAVEAHFGVEGMLG
jgi:hypothetical protein